jgi:hypothetical protein
MDQYKFSWCEPRALDRHLQGDWYHVTDVNGESVGYVIKRRRKYWVLLLEDRGGQWHAPSRKAVMQAAGLL